MSDNLATTGTSSILHVPSHTGLRPDLGEMFEPILSQPRGHAPAPYPPLFEDVSWRGGLVQDQETLLLFQVVFPQSHPSAFIQMGYGTQQWLLATSSPSLPSHPVGGTVKASPAVAPEDPRTWLNEVQKHVSAHERLMYPWMPAIERRVTYSSQISGQSACPWLPRPRPLNA